MGQPQLSVAGIKRAHGSEQRSPHELVPFERRSFFTKRLPHWEHIATSNALSVSKPMMWQLPLQVGEFDLVISLGTKLLAKWESRPFRRDVLLSMALAQCGLASEVLGLQQVGTTVRGPAPCRSCCSVRWPARCCDCS